MAMVLTSYQMYRPLMNAFPLKTVMKKGLTSPFSSVSLIAKRAISSPSISKRTLSSPAIAEVESDNKNKNNNKNNNSMTHSGLSEKDVQEGKDSMFVGVSRSFDVVLDSGKGSIVTDIYGKKYLDFTSGIGALSTGHCHPKVTEAVVNQASKLVHAQTSVVYHEMMLRLIKRMKDIFPSSLDSFNFWNSGSEAVEAAIKLAKHATKKPNIICFQGGYHGRTYGALALTSSKTCYSVGFGPFPSGIYTAPYPYSSQLPKGLSQSDISNYCIEEVERTLLQRTSPSDTAAIIVETILGEGGYVVPPKDFLPRLKDICEKNDILLILDEVQCGYGRTGKMFAFEHFGVVPDIAIIAKGIASGYPMSGIVTRKELSKRQPPGCMGGTYSGNAVSCAAALATLEVFEEEKILENVVARGKELEAGLHGLVKKGYPIKEVRGLGLMQAIELDQSVPKGTVNTIVKELAKEGILVLTCSIYETIRFIPSLNIKQDEMKMAIQKLNIVMDRIFQKI